MPAKAGIQGQGKMEKQQILDEIKRTANANGGTPLGIERFQRETGIKPSDWRGRHWVRWGDALQEAGFAPNALQAAYDEAELIEKFVALMRELGHFPSDAEIRFKSHNDAAFPSNTTFWKRLGNKPEAVARVSSYCKEKPSYEDVLRMCAQAGKAERSAPSDKSENEEDFGFVYLLKVGRYYKIGRSNAVGRRERELAIQLPEKSNTVHAIRTDDPAGIEAYWHKRFETKRANGEWFALTSADVKTFSRRKFM